MKKTMKRIVAVMAVAALSDTMFTGCGTKIESDKNEQ